MHGNMKVKTDSYSFPYKNVRNKGEDFFYWGTKNQGVERRNGKTP